MTTSPSDATDAAVEAALSALFPKGPISEFSRTTWERTVNEILEAAAPHMLAEAWDDAFKKGAEWGEWGAGPATQSEPDNLNANPYRTAK